MLASGGLGLGRVELRERVFTNRLEQREAAALEPAHEALLDEVRHCTQIAADRLGRRAVEAAGEDREAPEQARAPRASVSS